MLYKPFISVSTHGTVVLPTDLYVALLSACTSKVNNLALELLNEETRLLLGPVRTYPDNYYPILSEESFIG